MSRRKGAGDAEAAAMDEWDEWQAERLVVESAEPRFEVPRSSSVIPFSGGRLERGRRLSPFDQ